MPTISIFIRKDDLPIWQALENKSAFLSNALRVEKKGIEFIRDGGTIKLEKDNKTVELDIPLNVLKVPSERLQNGLCKIHGTPLDIRGRCLQKGCKYA